MIETTGKVVKKLFPQKSNLMLPQEPQARHRLWEKVTLLVILTEKGFNIPHYPKQLKRYLITGFEKVLDINITSTGSNSKRSARTIGS